MPRKSKNVVGDPTDPKGTLRPNLHPEIGTGESQHYEPLICPGFDRIINLPTSINRADPLAIWSLFFTCESLDSIIQNTNKKGASLRENQGEDAWQWKDIDISELYAYLAILFYMGLHIENDSELYWSQREDRPLHRPIITAMGRKRWHNIHRAFHISDPTIPANTVFERLEPLNLHVWEASRWYWIPSRDLAVDECMERFTG